MNDRQISITEALNQTQSWLNAGEYEKVIQACQEILIIEFSSKAEMSTEARVGLFDANGQELFSLRLKKPKESLDLSSIESGLYFLKIEANGKVEYRRLVKE